MKTLVLYASRHGSTAEIAERIARRLADRGVPVEIRPVDAPGDFVDFEAIVFGAPVYDQSWPPEATRFVTRHEGELAARPLWLFSVGSFGDTKRLLGPLARKEPKEIGSLRARLRPRDYRVFQGVIEKHQWPFWSRMLFHLFGGRFGDHRDWAVIDGWAEEIAAALSGQGDETES
jgi:menaquinone-dependent protoporphyrinogen oxidase